MSAVLLLTSALLFSAFGCGTEHPLPDESRSSSRPPESQISADLSEPSSEAEKPPLQTEPVRQLHCFAASGTVVRILDAGDQRVGILCADPAEIGAQDWEENMRFCLVDLAEGRVEAERPDVQIGDLLGMGEQGELVELDYINAELRIYDSSFSVLHVVHLEDVLSPLFDRRTQSVYCIDREKLLRIGLDGSVQELAYLPGVVQLDAYDSENGLAYLYEGDLDENGSGIDEISAYSVREQRVLYTVQASSVSCAAPHATWLSTIRADAENENALETAVWRYDPLSGKKENGYALPQDGYLSDVGASGFGYWVKYGFDIEDKPSFRMIDLNSGRLAEWEVGETDDVISKALLINDGQNAVCVTSDSSSRLKLFVTAPDLLVYSSALEEAAEEAGAEKPRISEALQEQRDYADRVESLYSVRILIGEECSLAKSSFSYELVLTDGGKRNSRKALTKALQTLAETLELYPEGFFRTFRNYRDAGGVRFLLVDDLVNPYGSFVPGGACIYGGGWYNIAIDVNAISKRLVHHELWHAVEDRIGVADRGAIDDEEWAERNPPGFSYLYDYDHYTEQKEILKLILPVALKEAWFTELYSATRPEEDRATLIEEVLSDTYNPDYYEEPDPLTMIRSAPRLNAKLTYLEDPVRRVFGTVYWEEIVAKNVSSGWAA